MAERAVMEHITSEDITSPGGGIAMNIWVHYTDYTNETEEAYDVNVQASWPGLTTTALHTAMVDAIIAAQPDGYDLAASDVLILPFVKGSLI